ncbi:hypothetical protein MKW94_014287 [Papaver nudicaule]|uniref:Uncharacterized protein n=1 Tax=Papaver nudicaule TaxID=74823 RepID=A0AA41V7I3_PAPNU|nr:hypothetical protein [Papaver nudicaule]
MISDGFLPWSLESASKVSIPRFVFDGVIFNVDPSFPDTKLTMKDFEPEFVHSEPGEQFQ